MASITGHSVTQFPHPQMGKQRWNFNKLHHSVNFLLCIVWANVTPYFIQFGFIQTVSILGPLLTNKVAKVMTETVVGKETI
jgi:hypothetical protein